MPIHTVSILGCGWLGYPLAKHLHQAGYQIKTASRSPLEHSHSNNWQHYQFAIDSQQHIADGFLDTHVLIINITCKQLEAYGPLLSALKQKPGLKVIFVSSTSVYQNSETTVTESRGPINQDSALWQIEQALQQIPGLKLNILRFSGLIGYSRHPGRFFKSGRIIAAPNHRVNMIHRDDCIGIIQVMLQQNEWGETFNACADSHPQRLDFYTQARHHLGLPVPEFAAEEPSADKVISNTKLKRFFNYEFQHPDLLAWSQLPFEL